MKYQKSTLEKFMKIARLMLDFFLNLIALNFDLKVSVSKGNKKIGKALNVSTLPIFTCKNCKECKHYCYDIKACVRYKDTLRARARNTAMALENRAEYFNQINEELKHHKTHKYFRWHVAGDILDMDYLENMIKIAIENPDWTFWTYTKMYGFINHWLDLNGELPANFKCMFSVWNGVPVYNPHNMPTFSVLMEADKEREQELFGGVFKCRGNCDACKADWQGDDKFPSNEGKCRGCIAGESAYVDEH